MTTLLAVKSFSLALIVSLLALAAVAADKPVVDVGEELAQARKAWQEGDALGAKARKDFALLEKQEKAYEKARDSFRAALKKDPKNPHALAEFGRFCLARKDYAQARARLEAARYSSLEPKDGKPEIKGSRAEQVFDPGEFADIFRTLGGLLERSGDANQAQEYYREALKRDPPNEKNLLSLAISLCASGRPEDSRTLLQPWFDKLPPEPASPAKAALQALGVYTMALALEESGLIDDAMNTYRRAFALAQKAGPAEGAGVAENASMAVARLEDLFDAMLAQTKERERLNEARKAKQQEPLPPIDERAAFAFAAYRCAEGVKLKGMALADNAMNTALARLRAGEGDAADVEKQPAFESYLAAMQAFQDAIQKYPRLARAHYELGICNVLLGRFGSARTLLDAAALYSPNNLAILNLQGEVLLELGQWEEAAAAFRRILLVEHESGSANFGLARAYAGLQTDAARCQAALNALERAAALGLRDPRMIKLDVLVLNNGRELTGVVQQEHDNYLVHQGGASALEVPKSDVKEVLQRPGLRDQLISMVERFERGEKPASGPVLRGSNRPGRNRPGAGPNPWTDTIFDQ